MPGYVQLSAAVVTALVASATAGTAPDVILATFDGAVPATTFDWSVKNDPVMGGGSTSTFAVTANGTGVFAGTCAIVKYLQAPGFASVHTYNTSAGSDGHSTFNPAGLAVNGTLDLMLRSATPTYTGFKVGWSALNIPIKPQYGRGEGSFKAGFQLQDQPGWQLVRIPMTAFSDDWSPFTGDCDTKDPTGKQHHCCGAGAAAQYCPTAAFLSTLTDLAIWAEGVVGTFQIEVRWIGASR